MRRGNQDFEINLCDQWHLVGRLYCLDQNIKVYFRFRIYKSIIMALIGSLWWLDVFFFCCGNLQEIRMNFTFEETSLGRHIISSYHAFKDCSVSQPKGFSGRLFFTWFVLAPVFKNILPKIKKWLWVFSAFSQNWNLGRL